ncbi:hypothetical protein Taro_037481, partial [Colocasia esculenta]|nr:hypothetical protein [Colocasia esculenta]
LLARHRSEDKAVEGGGGGGGGGGGRRRGEPTEIVTPLVIATTAPSAPSLSLSSPGSPPPGQERSRLCSWAPSVSEGDGSPGCSSPVFPDRKLKAQGVRVLFLQVFASTRMGFEEGIEKGGLSWGLRSLMRRKQVDSERVRVEGGHHQLAKELSILQLIAIGVGSTIGAGVYVLVGTVAREHAGPALTISFLIAGIAAALSAFCYAELASLLGVVVLYTDSIHFTFQALFFGGPDSLPFFLGRTQIPGLGIVVDPCAAILVLVVTTLLCVGIKESSFVQAIVTTLNVFVMMFVIIAGGYLGFQTGWVGYSVASGYFPYGVDGMLSGAATVFFAYIGFDSVASTAEEVKNPQRDLPWGIGLALSACCLLYMLVSVIIVGLVPYFAMDPDTPISSAFASHGMHWAMYIITAGAVLALCATLMGSLLPQPRILMAMSRDGLLPPFFADINKKTQVPVKSTILTGFCAAFLAFFMDVSQLAGMVSVGTLLAFTIVAVSILILRYVPPDEVPLPSSLQGSIDSVSSRYNGGESSKNKGTSHANDLEESSDDPLLIKENEKDKANEQERRKKAAVSIAFVCVGVVILTSAASAAFLPPIARFSTSAVGGLFLLLGLGVLSWIDQDDGRHSFGHSGGRFHLPFGSTTAHMFHPHKCIPANKSRVMTEHSLPPFVSSGTWMRVSVWLVIGVFVYLFYGRRHSSLTDAVYVSAAHVDEIYKNSYEPLS